MSSVPKHALCPHPSLLPAFAMSVEAGVAMQSDDALVFSFQCRYQSDDTELGILVPSPMTPIACDNLWQHTCCEAFVSVPDAHDYLEFNFSPSGCWAVYRFDAYRLRDESYVCPSAPKIEVIQTADGFGLTATISPKILPQTSPWDISLTAVIETTDMRKSYWALRHDAAQADFHLRSQFLIPLQH